MAKAQPADPSLYERDFFAWTQDQAAKLRAREHGSIDWGNVAEELADLGRREEREIEDRLNVLLMHLVKWEFQAAQRSRAWKATIIQERYRLKQRIEENPSLKAYPGEVLAEEYGLVRMKVAAETDLPEDTFPQSCPFRLEDILDPDFYPDGE